MADGYWNSQARTHPSAGLFKRPRADYAHEMQGYLAQDVDQAGPWVVKDTNAIGSAYDRYLQNVQLSSSSSGEASRLVGVGLEKTADVGLYGSAFTGSVPMGRPGVGGANLASNGHGMGFDTQLPLGTVARSGHEALPLPLVDSMPRLGREILPLPPDASSTLYVEGLPSDCKKREVAHIFRPFVGYKEVRLVSKESRHRSGDPIILCFVDFMDPACAATALSALQGYKMDEDDSDSAYLRLQFSKYPGPRSAPGCRGRR